MSNKSGNRDKFWRLGVGTKYLGQHGGSLERQQPNMSAAVEFLWRRLLEILQLQIATAPRKQRLHCRRAARGASVMQTRIAFAVQQIDQSRVSVLKQHFHDFRLVPLVLGKRSNMKG